MKIKILMPLLFLSTMLFAQKKGSKFSIKWGPELKGANSGSVSDLLGTDDNGYYFGAYLKSDYTIEKLDKDLDNPVNFVFEERDREAKERYSLFARKYFADKLYVFKTNLDKDTKTTTLYAEEINKNNMTSNGKLKKLAEIQYEKRRDKGDFSVYTSESDNYLMIIESIPVEKDENEKLRYEIQEMELRRKARNPIQFRRTRNRRNLP